MKFLVLFTLMSAFKIFFSGVGFLVIFSYLLSTKEFIALTVNLPKVLRVFFGIL